MLEDIDQSVLDSQVTGLNLKPGTLRDQLYSSESQKSLLVFLRHFG